MRLLDRYLLRELLIPLGYCLGGFLIFWISFDLLSELVDFQARHLLAMDLVEYYLVKTPELLAEAVAICCGAAAVRTNCGRVGASANC